MQKFSSLYRNISLLEKQVYVKTAPTWSFEQLIMFQLTDVIQCIPLQADQICKFVIFRPTWQKSQ